MGAAHTAGGLPRARRRELDEAHALLAFHEARRGRGRHPEVPRRDQRAPRRRDAPRAPREARVLRSLATSVLEGNFFGGLGVFWSRASVEVPDSTSSCPSAC